MKLGLVTYQMAAKWDCDTIIRICSESGFEGVELRTTHAHGVEPSLSKSERDAVKRKFADSPVELMGLGTTVEYHSADAAELKRQIGLSRDFAQLAVDVAALGIKVRPNALQLDKGIPEEKTLEQIGKGFRESARICRDMGVECWMEVHGRDTCHPVRIRKILDYADEPACLVCWNSNSDDKDETGSIDRHFELLKERIAHVHIQELWEGRYPWKHLFGLLKGIGYRGYMNAEIPGAACDADALRIMRFYRACWDALKE
ncbi:MAG TPA: sugar phosphate isomerase/epimerase [Planctomycetes bacterium]|nr:sugar phosphate isomerase/epimerase [Planctomycetota bacterium]